MKEDGYEFASEAMKSGYDNYTGIWGNPYYDDVAILLRGKLFSPSIFAKSPALVAIQSKDGWREEREYDGQPFDPKVWKLVKSRWDHQHCRVCQFSISEGMTYWTTEDGRNILCDACHEHYMEPPVNG